MQDSTFQRRNSGVLVGVVAIIVVSAIGYVAITNPAGPSTAQSPSTGTTQSTLTSNSSDSSTQSSVRTINQTTCTGNVTEGLGITWPSCGCALVDSTSSGSLYVQSNLKVGDDVCIAAAMNGTSSVSFTITNSTGSRMFTGVCAATGGMGNQPVTGDSCLALWNTAQPDPRGNPIQPGDYELTAIGDSQSLRANFTLGPGPAP
jgi:hypothetical protein